jgi:chromosome segregation ATPase
MGAIWNEVVSFVRAAAGPSERRALRAGGGQPAHYPADASLEAIGKRNETLRAQFEEVQHGFEGLTQVKGMFHGLLPPVAELLTEFEATKTRLHETKMKLALIEETHESLASRHAAALQESNALAAAKNALSRENREAALRVQRLDAALSDAQTELRGSAAGKDKADRLLEIETRLTAGQNEEIRRLKDEMSAKDQSLAGGELALKAANDQGALLSQEIGTLRESSQGLSTALDAASRRIADLETQLDQAKHRILALEQSLGDEASAHASLRARHLEHVERAHGEISTLNNTIHAVRGRVEVTNKLLDQTRAQLREKIEELRAAERRLLENGIHIDSLDKTARSLKDDLTAANDRIAGTERMRGALVDEVNALNEALRGKEAALQSATRTIEQQTARIDELASGRQRAREELERRTAALQDEIARLRAERSLADGALEASRAERLQARRSLATIGEPLREPTLPVDASAPQPSNVTKLAARAAG